MTRELTLGIVGHVDHGKTALVEALTGTLTDRLPEERARGLSIVLGFAYLETPKAVVELIDVPGHEDFVRAMIAGATGVDGILLVVAANEGIKPQTREHFGIARLLGLEHGLVVITKSDLATAERVTAVTQEILALTRGSFLERAPILVASAKDASSIANVRAAIEQLAENPVARPEGRDFLLPVDRVFTVSGFGVVVTGTLRNGRIAADDEVTIWPRGRNGRIRGLERHNRPVDAVLAGQRVAVNLRGIEHADVARGDVIARPGLLEPTARLDAELALLADAGKPLKNGTRLRVLTGATEVIARLRLLDTDELAPGSTAFVQLRLEDPIATLPGERYVARSYSPMRTVGGGRVLDTHPERHRRFDVAALRNLARRAAGDIERLVADALARAGNAGIDLKATAASLGITDARLRAALTSLKSVAVSDSRTVSAESFDKLRAELMARVDAFHAAHPHERGLSLKTLQSDLELDAEMLQHAIADLVRDGSVEHLAGVLRRVGFVPKAALNESERRLIDSIEAMFLDAGLDPPEPKNILGGDRHAGNLYRLLLERGRLIRLNTYARGTQIVLHAETLANARRRLAERFPHPERFTVAQARDLLNSTRKHITPLMEHLDATGFTIRVGDLRQLRAP